MNPALGIAAALLVLAAVYLKQAQAVHLALLSLPWLLTRLLLPSLSWPFHLLLPLMIYAGLVGAVPSLRSGVLWLRPGRYGADIGWLTAITMLLSGTGLLLWYYCSQPNLTPFLEQQPELPLALVPLAGLGFAILNAIMEESVFRGILMQSLESALGYGWIPVVGQAVLFGVMHYPPGAFPNGLWGVGLTFIYGIVLGLIRRRSLGILAPIVAHVLADAVVFAIVAVVKITGNA